MSNISKDGPYYEALPTKLKPYNYDLSIYDIDLSRDVFKGTVVIHLNVVEKTNELYLNYRDITVVKENIKVENDGKIVSVDSIEENKQKEYFVVKFAENVSNGGKVNVTIDYEAIIQSNMAGFYKSAFNEDGKEKHMLSTQFEATDARRAFPCLDEPCLKTTFNVDISADSRWTILGNMPVKSKVEVSKDLQKVSFEQTPIMSTYLLAWACGEFEYIESFTKENYNGKPLPVRIYTTKGYLEEAKLASEITPKIVDYFSKIFEIAYPLPKLDLIAVHSFSHNAMENWGLITYRSTALLFSETKSDPSYKQKVAYVVAHELAHQWFGNLVTMKWWDELWLNEGFATWVGFVAVDHLYPEWDIFSGFVSESLEQALDLDGLRKSHPIEVPVVDALDIDQVFDAISYLKGASTILMISKYLGTKVFLEGVSLYLERNKYSNATSHDLWSAISEVSQKPINQWMNSWIKKVGFPIVNVSSHENSLVLSQSRFLNGGDVQPEENETKWWIPLNVATDCATIHEKTTDALDSEKLIIGDFLLKKDGFFKINKDTAGVYRVNYGESFLTEHVSAHFDKLSARDKVGLIADSAAIACAGNNTTTSFLKLVKDILPKLGNDYVVWLELGKRLGDFSTAFTTKELVSKIQNLLSSVYEERSVKIVEDIKEFAKLDSSDFLETKYRSELLTRAGKLHIEPVYQFALGLFSNQGGEIHPALRLFVYTTIAASPHFTKEQYETILKQVTHPTSLDSREIALTALGSVNNMAIIEQLLPSLIDTNIIPVMDVHFVAKPLSINHATKDLFLDFFLDNYESFYKIMSTNMVVLDRFVKLTLRNYQSEVDYNKIKKFFASRNVHGFERSLYQALDNIKINANWFARDREEVVNYLQDY
ncbi:hypothetical protein KGF56_001945 [Candida oxycetoniae]|uniref:Aminopeptidase n=1 Tax=Candida oxycetoniae TaxID=497107 RepID=A0AAI9SYI5_9ASCO|nr:uncharacterized protein KGF56_001945 [Candida oxycetoniae]KAI3405253.2 hypothetical protein KGF56_001945 [Candida oxycetoniae]